MYAVSPFYLQHVEDKMEKTVAGQDNEYFAGLFGATGKGRRKEKAEEKACLGCAVQPEIIGVKEFQGQETMQDNPR